MLSSRAPAADLNAADHLSVTLDGIAQKHQDPAEVRQHHPDAEQQRIVALVVGQRL
jgi:hypothetical protein